MTENSLSAAAVRTIQQRIESGAYPPGTRLPSERVLAPELAISRTALRDALQRLEAMGFLEARGSRGRFVRDHEARRGPDAALSWLLLHRHDVSSLNQVRSLLEPSALESLSDNDAAVALAEASSVVEEQLRALSQGRFEEASDLDAEFHALLVRHAPNVPLRELAEQLIELGRVPGARLYGIRGVGAVAVAEHEDILEALARGDRSHAAELLKFHHIRSAERSASSSPDHAVSVSTT
jgi:GntR family transcriptional repressor for pyruvate dehydrogenase complex